MGERFQGEASDKLDLKFSWIFTLLLFYRVLWFKPSGFRMEIPPFVREGIMDGNVLLGLAFIGLSLLGFLGLWIFEKIKEK